MTAEVYRKGGAPIGEREQQRAHLANRAANDRFIEAMHEAIKWRREKPRIGTDKRACTDSPRQLRGQTYIATRSAISEF